MPNYRLLAKAFINNASYEAGEIVSFKSEADVPRRLVNERGTYVNKLMGVLIPDPAPPPKAEHPAPAEPKHLPNIKAKE